MADDTFYRKIIWLPLKEALKSINFKRVRAQYFCRFIIFWNFHPNWNFHPDSFPGILVSTKFWFSSKHLNLFRNRKSRCNRNRTHRDSSCNKEVIVIHIMIHLYVDKLVESVQNSILVLAQSLHIFTLRAHWRASRSALWSAHKMSERWKCYRTCTKYINVHAVLVWDLFSWLMGRCWVLFSETCSEMINKTSLNLD